MNTQVQDRGAKCDEEWLRKVRAAMRGDILTCFTGSRRNEMYLTETRALPEAFGGRCARGCGASCAGSGSSVGLKLMPPTLSGLDPAGRKTS